MRKLVLAFSVARVEPLGEAMVVVPVEEPLTLRCLQLRGCCSQFLDVLSAGVVGGALLRAHGNNVLNVVWTEVDDLRSGPLDEANGVWPLLARGAQRGDYLAAWVRNMDPYLHEARGHFVVGAPT
jgi:hypothetical protein